MLTHPAPWLFFAPDWDGDDVMDGLIINCNIGVTGMRWLAFGCTALGGCFIRVGRRVYDLMDWRYELDGMNR